MPRAALRALLALGLAAASAAAQTGARTSLDPHLDTSLVPAGCSACHRGHGASRSPMLPEAQQGVCLACHGSRAQFEAAVRRGLVSPEARPLLLSQALAQPSRHPMEPAAYSEHEGRGVTCSSCHSPHRGMRDRALGGAPPGRRRMSPKDPRRFEYELCESCHGSRGALTRSLADISRMLDPGNRSYHPVHAPSRDGSPSVIPSLRGREINCSDCHGNSDPQGARGPHGSPEAFLLKARYVTVDGAASDSGAALCYGCHDREAVLRASPFPGHQTHVERIKASCATCHSGHGSVGNRALIRFGEETLIAGVAPSAQTGRLAFVSTGPGSGACYLTCHGRDHAPETYGLLPPGPKAGGLPTSTRRPH